ncbi:hypothetical protein EVAR_92795_1 [Eumeta japonica]|uniref:Uncharacterized protein n=1 Tax=Eumeta variegata TaxID=151549 RepID=A0A4C2A3R4_EUMVA|nr:hypothetical protein EVAR_92795_1 [Eumeta japonica]
MSDSFTKGQSNGYLLTDFKKRSSRVGRVRPPSLLGRIGRWSGKEIAHPALFCARARLKQNATMSHAFPPCAFHQQYNIARNGLAAPPPAPGWPVERRPGTQECSAGPGGGARDGGGRRNAVHEKRFRGKNKTLMTPYETRGTAPILIR